MMSYTRPWTCLWDIGSTLMRRTSPCTRIMGGRPEDRCRSDALFLTENASSWVMSMWSVTPARAYAPARMASIAENILQVRGRISSACRAFDRLPATVHLLAVSKTCPGVSVREASAAGQRDFGENYVQEALAKIAELADLRPDAGDPIRWHLIGPLQSNKAREGAANFDR